jgi:UDP-glucose 4-epimerase
MVDRLLEEGHEVVGFDNFSTGNILNLTPAGASKRFKLVQGNLTEEHASLDRAMEGADIVYHFAANADIRGGVDNPGKDFTENTLATHHLLTAMRYNNVKRIVFASSAAVYGESEVRLPETAPFPVQTSFYGASKVACEGMITAHCYAYGFHAWIFRFAAVIGERYAHGCILDFYNKIRENPKSIEVLGDGQQLKSSLYVRDCIDGIQLAVEKAKDLVNIFNLGCDPAVLTYTLSVICEHLKVDPERRYTGGPRGWVGDSPVVCLNTSKIHALGWRPKVLLREGITKTLDYLCSKS